MVLVLPSLCGITLLPVSALPVTKEENLTERALWSRINTVRQSHGLRELAWNDQLAKLARRHSEYMARTGKFTHDDPEGDLQVRLEKAGFTCWSCAENLFQAQGLENLVQGAVNGWMKSKGHRRNILTPDFDMTGLGVVIDKSGTFWITQQFWRSSQQKR